MIWLMLACTQPQPAATEPAAGTDPIAEDGWGNGCSMTNEAGCLRWAEKAVAQGQDYRPFLVDHCEKGASGSACYKLGLYMKNDGSGAEAELKPLFERACTLGNPGGCQQYAKFLEGDEKHAILEKGCLLECYWCCKEIGREPPTW